MTALDDRLRNALHDLDARAATHAARPRTAARTATRHRRTSWLVPALAAVAVVAVLAAGAISLRPGATGHPTPPATRGAATPTPTKAWQPPSQDAAGARLWGVFPQIAALPLAARTARAEDGPEPVVTPEGVWQVAHPDITKVLATGDNGCTPHPRGAPRYDLCSTSYSEIQLLSPDRSRLLRVYPFPEITVQWIRVTPHAVYCGRTGDGAIPESMLCRINRGGDLTMTGRFYACDGPDCAPLDTGRWGRFPGIWRQGTEPVDGGFDAVELKGNDLVVTDSTGRVTVRVDPTTLVER